MADRKIDWVEIRRQLGRKAARLYWILEGSGGLTMSEIMMKRGFKNRAELDLELAKLRRLNLVERDKEEGYGIRLEIRETVNFLLKKFVVFRGHVMPRAIMSAFLAILVSSLYGFTLGPAEAAFMVFLGSTVALIFVLVSFHTWSKRPWRERSSK